MACVKHYAANSMENARFTVDVTVDERDAARGLPAALPARSWTPGVAAVMSAYNSRQRRVVRAEPGAAHRDPARRVGLRRRSSCPTSSGACATRPARSRPAWTWRCRSPSSGRRCPRRWRGAATGRRRAGRAPDPRGPSCAFAAAAAARPRPDPEVVVSADAPGAGPRGGGARRWCCCATSRWTARRCCRWTRALSPPRRRSAGSPTCANTGDHGSSDVRAPAVVTPLAGLRAALPGRRGRVARPTPTPRRRPRGRRRRGRRRRLHRRGRGRVRRRRSTRTLAGSTRRSERPGRRSTTWPGSGTPARSRSAATATRCGCTRPTRS